MEKIGKHKKIEALLILKGNNKIPITISRSANFSLGIKKFKNALENEKEGLARRKMIEKM